MSDIPKMDPAMKRRWLKAMRSGEYRHTTGRFMAWSKEDGYCHCALGVLVDIEHEGDWVAEPLYCGRTFYSLADESYWDVARDLLNTDDLSAIYSRNDDYDNQQGYEPVCKWIEENL